jgi:hypothetical protein
MNEDGSYADPAVDTVLEGWKSDIEGPVGARSQCRYLQVDFAHLGILYDESDFWRAPRLRRSSRNHRPSYL